VSIPLVNANNPQVGQIDLGRGDLTSFSIRVVVAFTSTAGARILNVDAEGASTKGGIFVNNNLEVRDAAGNAVDTPGKSAEQLKNDVFYAITIATSNGELDLYVDGRLVGTWTRPGFEWKSVTKISDSLSSLVLFNNCGDAAPACNCQPNSGGMLHSVQLFDRRLRKEEISGLESCATAEHFVLGSDSGCYGGEPGLRNVSFPSGQVGNLQVYCDSQTDGGGWVLLLSYTHKAGSSRPLQPGRQPVSPLGYSHTTLNKILPNVQSKHVAGVRFRCTSGSHRRTVHFVSNHPKIIADAIAGSQTTVAGDWKKHLRLLPDHSGKLPLTTSATGSTNGDGFTGTPFKSDSHAWSMQAQRWECDDILGKSGGGVGTHHEVWVKMLPGVLSGIDRKTLAPRSCSELLAQDHTTKSGWHLIPSPVVPGLMLSVWCDMVTDGGGYTLLPVTAGISVARIDQENSCTKMGLQLMVWRSKAHQTATLQGPWLPSGDAFSYFKAVPGVVSLRPFVCVRIYIYLSYYMCAATV
jgi:hypothetical protein